ncbi:hypothetical protein ISCGN_001404 [Ixodes scapularis]
MRPVPFKRLHAPGVYIYPHGIASQPRWQAAGDAEAFWAPDLATGARTLGQWTFHCVPRRRAEGLIERSSIIETVTREKPSAPASCGI